MKKLKPCKPPIHPKNPNDESDKKAAEIASLVYGIFQNLVSDVKNNPPRKR